MRARTEVVLRAVGRALRPHPFELVALAMAVVALAFLRLRGLAYGWNTVEYTFPPLFRALPRLFALGVGLRILHRLVARTSVRDYLRAIVRPAWIALWLRCWLATMLLIYTYCWLKISIPLLTDRLYDPQLWRLDRFLHFGFSPSIFAVELAAGTPVARWLDIWYALWAPTLAIFVGFFYALAKNAERRNFTLAVVLLWTIGAWIYLALPALGPCYASPDLFASIHRELPYAVTMQQKLWSHYLMMVHGRTGALSSFQPEFGVAALPSLHVGAHALFFFWARRHERWLVVPAAIATTLTLVGSVVTGWHYAVDGYFGIALAWAVVALADRWDPVETAPLAADLADAVAMSHDARPVPRAG
jgi:hypothetical protein